MSGHVQRRRLTICYAIKAQYDFFSCSRSCNTLNSLSVCDASGRGALDLLQEELSQLGFTCHRLPFGDGDERIDNLFAIYGDAGHGSHFCFAGHTDVVPAGDDAAWRHGPFDGNVEDGKLYGRGAVDMKGAIAAFVIAVKAYLNDGSKKDIGQISLLITGDEEGDAIYGTKPVLDWLDQHGMMPDAFLVGEPTNPEHMGDVIKNGRRGSLSCELTVHGRQGHAAYPHRSDNPLPRLMRMLEPVSHIEIDKGNDHFDPSTAAITSIDTGNPARNVTPQQTTAKFNIRYSSDHSAESLKAWLIDHFNHVGGEWSAEWYASANPFITTPGDYTDLIVAAIETVTGRKPELSTSGGTSDARFIAPYADVVEFGLIGQTMHQIDEFTTLDDLTQLTHVYQEVLNQYFARNPKTKDK